MLPPIDVYFANIPAAGRAEIALLFQRKQLLAAVVALSLLIGCDPSNRSATPEQVCAHNLKQIDCAAMDWARDHHRGTNEMPTWGDLQPYLGTTNITCSAGGSYRLVRVASMPECSAPEHAHLARKLRGDTMPPP